MAYLLLILFLLLALLPLITIAAFFFGPPYVPTPMKYIQQGLDLAQVSEEDVVFDLGSGDGRLLIEAAKRGARAEGWEINPYLVLFTTYQARRAGVRKRVTIHWGNYKKAPLNKATVIFLYVLGRLMPPIEKKVQKLPKGTEIICYTFPFPNLKPKKVMDKKLFFYVV